MFLDNIRKRHPLSNGNSLITATFRIRKGSSMFFLSRGAVFISDGFS